MTNANSPEAEVGGCPDSNLLDPSTDLTPPLHGACVRNLGLDSGDGQALGIPPTRTCTYAFH